MLPWKQLFCELFVSIDLLGPKKRSYHLHKKSQYTFCALKSCSLTFAMSDNTRKNWPKSFLDWKVCIFSQKFVFSTTSKFLKKWSYNFHSKCQNTVWTLTNCSLRFLRFDNTRKKKRQKLLSSWKQLFLELFVPIDLLGPKKLILSLAQWLSKNLVDLYKGLSALFQVGYYEEN